jgi:hypothetical protein
MADLDRDIQVIPIAGDTSVNKTSLIIEMK